MKKIFVYMLAIAFVFLLLACGTIKETTTTTTEPIKIPAVVINHTDTLYLVLTKEGYGFVSVDSLKQWTLENLCKGELIIDTLGLKAKFTYSWKKIVSSLSDSLNDQIRMNQILKADLEKKAQELQGKTTTKTTESTPGQLWIWTHSFLYQFLAAVFAITVLIFLQLKMKLVTKYLP
jgi:hypothetical protein